MPDKRRAQRIALNVPTIVESIGSALISLPQSVQPVYERVIANAQMRGKKIAGLIRDLSTNGVFIAGEVLPLLSRVRFKFNLDGHGDIEAIGWILWRRTEDCEVPRDAGELATLPRGFGVLFESISIDARVAIHKMVIRASD